MTAPHYVRQLKRRWPWLFVALVPMAIYVVIAERNSWRPKTLRMAVRPAAEVYSLSWSADCQTLAVSDDRENLQLWNTQKRTLRKTIKWLHDRREALSDKILLSSDGLILASRCFYENSIAWRSWDARDGRELIRFDRPFFADYFAFVDKQTCLLGEISNDWNFHGEVQSKSLTVAKTTLSGKILRQVQVNVPRGTRFSVSSTGPPLVKCDMTGKRQIGAIGIKKYVSISKDSYYTTFGVLLFSARSGKHLKLLPVSSVSPASQIGNISFSDDGHSLAVAVSSDGFDSVSEEVLARIDVWDVQTGKLRAFVPSAPETPLAFSFDGKILATSAPHSKGITLWDGQTGKLSRLIKSQRIITALAFSPDGKTLAAGDDAGAIKLYRVQ